MIGSTISWRSLVGRWAARTVAALFLACPGLQAADRAPNIIFIVADDLGYGDVGCYGQKKIRTPNLDRLAAEGIRFTQHYAGSPVCAPSRCVLLTGLHSGHAPIRDNREAQPEGQFPLAQGTQTLPQFLQRRGYATGAFGKWGLGGPGTSGDPLRQGFERFFGYNCQRLAHNYYPTSLWDNSTSVPLRNPAFSPYQKMPPAMDANDLKSYASYRGDEYAPDRIADEALRFLRENQDRPFLLFYPTTVPHLALQVPEDSLAEYLGQFPEEPYRGDRNYLPHRAPRAAYAAMVTRMDRDIGRILDLVTELKLNDQTIIVFTSDNGPLYDALGGTDTDFFQSAGAFRGRKGSVYEGGVRVPAIVRWSGHIAAGTVSDRVTGFEDWLPTLLELAGRRPQVTKPVDGVSFAPTLLGRQQTERAFLYREFSGYGGQQSVRVGDWKAVRQKLIPADKTQPIVRTELYNLAQDPGESCDVSAEHPETVRKLESLLRAEHLPSPDFPIPALDSPLPSP